MEIKGLSWFCAKKKGSHFKPPLQINFMDAFLPLSEDEHTVLTANRKQHTF